MQQGTNKSIDSVNSHEPLPPLSHLHPVELQLPQNQGVDSGTLGGKEGPPLRIPPPPPTSPPPQNQDLTPPQEKDNNKGQNKEANSCNG